MAGSDLDFVLDTLCTQIRSQIDLYRTQEGSAVPVTFNDGYPTGATPVADRALVDELFDTTLAFYDDLFRVDSTPYRKEWRRNLRYSPSTRQIIADLRANPRVALYTYVNYDGTYMPSTGLIGISRSTLGLPHAAVTIAGELLHAYQDAFDSPTSGHPLLEEGADAGMSILALAHLTEEFDHLDWGSAVAKYRLYVMLTGYAAIKSLHSSLEVADLTELGLSGSEIDEFSSGRLRRWFAPLAPRYRWAIDETDYEYNVGGALILAGQTILDEAFVADLFHGDEHAWSPVVDELTALILQRSSSPTREATKTIAPW